MRRRETTAAIAAIVVAIEDKAPNASIAFTISPLFPSANGDQRHYCPKARAMLPPSARATGGGKAFPT